MKFRKFFKRHTLVANKEIFKDNEMNITDVQRLKLAEKARVVFDEEADVFMAHLPVGGAEVLATKTDILILKGEIAATKAETLREISHQSVVVIVSMAGIVSAVAVIAGLVNAFLN
jgi:hypothetical protein